MPPRTEEDVREDEMYEVFGPARHGAVGGIEIDLRHPSLDPLEWEMPPLASRFEFATDFTWSPYIWFPWFGPFDPDRFAAAAKEFMAAERTNPVRTRKAIELCKMSVEDFVAAHSPIYFINYGDKIDVDKVEDILTGRKMEHDHDTYVKHVFLRILRSTGDIELINAPLIANGFLSILLDHQDKHYFIRVHDRILNHFGVQSSAELSDRQFDNSIANRALSVVNELSTLLEEPLNVVYGKYKRKAYKKYIQMRSVMDLVDLSVLVGFTWAKAEAEINLKPLAKTALQRKDFNKDGGKKSGEARRKIAQDGWMKIAKRLAFEIRAKEPGLSQDRLIKAIDKAWGNNKPVAPELPTLKKYISYLEKNEGLPPKPRKTSKIPTLIAAE